jgi:hypothetical protein
MATFDYTIYHNLRPYKMNNRNGQWMSIYIYNSLKTLIVLNFDEWMKNDVNMILWL